MKGRWDYIRLWLTSNDRNPNALIIGGLIYTNGLPAYLLCAACELSWSPYVCVVGLRFVSAVVSVIIVALWVMMSSQAHLVSLICTILAPFFCKLSCQSKGIKFLGHRLSTPCHFHQVIQFAGYSLLFLLSVALYLSSPPYLFVVTQHLVKTPLLSPSIL